MAASQAAGSRRHIESVARLYHTFCILAGLMPWPLSLFWVILFMVDNVHRGNSPASLSGVLSRLKRHSLEYGWSWFNLQQWFFIRAIRQGLRRIFREEPPRASPCTLAIIRQLLPHIDPADAVAYMTITMCVVAHDGLLRGGELRGLKVSDLRWDNAERTRCSIRIRTSKANQFGEWVPYELQRQAPHERSRFSAELRGTRGSQRTQPRGAAVPDEAVSRYGLAPTVTGHIQRAGLSSTDYTGHSFRSGGATDLFNGRCRPHTICKVGGHQMPFGSMFATAPSTGVLRDACRLLIGVRVAVEWLPPNRACCLSGQKKTELLITEKRRNRNGPAAVSQCGPQRTIQCTSESCQTAHDCS